MLRLGIISEIGEGENLGFARVSFDENDFVSGWLSLPSANTQKTKQWIAVAVNSQVACLMDSKCEQGCIVMALWSATDTPPEWATVDTMGVQFADGTEVYYDAKEHKLHINAPDVELNIKCKKLNVEGEINIKGNTTIEGETSIKGDTSVTGEITATKEVTAGIIKLTTHKHPVPGGTSGTPIP